jgi:hypothetical protein
MTTVEITGAMLRAARSLIEGLQDAAEILFRFAVAVLHRGIEVIHAGGDRARAIVRSWSAGSPRTMSPPTAPQPKPSTESCIPVRPKTRISIAIPPPARAVSRDRITGRHADPAYEKAT